MEVDEHLREPLTRLGMAINELFNGDDGSPPRTGYCLLVFPFPELSSITQAGPPPRGPVNFLSNANVDAGLVALLREQAKALEDEEKA